MVEGWARWMGKRVYLILKGKRTYSGVVKEVQDSGNGLVFISIIDKFDNWVTFSTGEIEMIEEERR